MMKLACVIPVYNREKFIGAFIEMMSFVDKIVVVLGEVPWNNDTEENRFADDTEKILQDYDIEIIKGIYPKMSDQINTGLDILGDYDYVFIFDCDMFFQKKDIDQILKEIEETRVELYRLDYEKNVTDFYYDWNYGQKPPYKEFLPVVVDPKKVRLKGINAIMSIPIGIKLDEYIFSNKIKAWHFRMAKRHNKPKYGKWIKAPKEIINKFILWKKYWHIQQ